MVPVPVPPFSAARRRLPGVGVVAAALVALAACAPTDPARLERADAVGTEAPGTDALVTTTTVAGPPPTPAAAPTAAAPTTTQAPRAVPTTPPPRPPGPPPVVSAVPTTDNVVFITIDDGAVRDPAVLEYLREKRWPVTVFPVTGFVSEDPAFFDALRDLGAHLHNHTTSHADLRKVGRAEQERQICGPVPALAARFGERPRLFRPPYGVYDATTVEVAGSCGYDAIVLWRADVWEGNLDVQSGDLRAGDIVLLHFRPDLLRSLQALDRYMAERQLRPGRLEDLIPAAPAR